MKLFINASLPTASAALKRVNLLFDETIVKISADDIATEESPEIIDLKGKILLPGGIDAHSHIIHDGEPAKSIAKVSKSALAGGWTTLCELSYFSPAPIFDFHDLERTIQRLNGTSHVDMALWGNVDIGDYPYHAETAQELWAKGVVGIALLTPSPNPAIPDISFTEIMDLFMDIYESDTAFAFQGFDYENHGSFDFASQLDGVKKILRRMQENPIHIPRVASYPSIEFINTISKRSDISFAMCIGDLMKVFGGIDPGSGLSADLEEHQELLFELFRTNKIYMLSNSVSAAAAAPETTEAFLGTHHSLMRHSYLWVLSELWKNRKVPLATCIKMTSENAAKRLGLYPVKGAIEVGSDADFMIYDPEVNTTFKAPDGSKHELTGSIDSVWLRGKEVFSDGKTAPPSGKHISRHTNPKRRYNNTTWI
ncbi:MAG: amidohydrolase family protein [Candidatus Cloacimonadaceae bacterium]|nr:amidohydrolase family protein [Candidatus Cloacimonadaceae bacterium]MDP3115332.1 amidohydrolase family protein [Candidatus Cloacimonadaceae bacterium]